ncbi:MAG: type II toxin-antitoxin system HigB family toxin [Luteibacter sp.]|uniref:type II toxin-antitoxin system HigB family toxin n=1 Tax=Luteibacter sp. TaxID=1886636 RepID=UPI002809F4FE|nr:type II toxin-antitoxin system HigB family toxin [Luteibacter sp.]MDQ7995279.1 type II toxin-antitoxin system HigB family toxin [Luteibacter sp.]
MIVISRGPFKDAAQLYPNDADALDRTYRMLKSGTFESPAELRKVFPSLDNFKYKDRWWVIDVGGNNLRLLAFINFEDTRIFVKHIFTHSEYDKFTDQCRGKKQS